MSRYYQVKNAPNNIEEVYIGRYSVNEHLSNVIGDALDDRCYSLPYKGENINDKEFGNKENEVLEDCEDNYYEPTPLGNEFFVTTNDLNYDMDEKKLIKAVLKSKFAGCEYDIKSCLEKAMDDLEYDCKSAELGDEIRIKGYHEEQEAELSITISVVSNRSVIYLTSIYMNNRGINIEDQILFARDIFK